MFLQNISPIGLFITNSDEKSISYLDLKHVYKYGSAKFQSNALFSSQQMATEHAKSGVEEKSQQQQQQQKVGKPIGDPVGTECPN